MSVCACSVTSVVSDSFEKPWTVARQAPLSMGFSGQEYWSGLPFPPPEDLPNRGIKTASPVSPALQADFLLLSLIAKNIHYKGYTVQYFGNAFQPII